MKLADLQAAFQAAILSGDDAILAEIIDSPHENRARLMGVYQHAYRARLMGVLGNDFPVLGAFAGAETFQDMAASYVATHVSGNSDVSHYGAGLAKHLAITAPWSAVPVLSELAALEHATATVSVAADGGRKNLASLGTLAPDDWPGHAFAPHATTRRLDCTSNAFAIWRAVLRGEPAPAAVPEPQAIIVFRPDWVPQVRPMAAEEAMMWDEMARRAPFGTLCQMVALHGGEENAPARAAGYLSAWIGAGMLAE